MNQVPIAIIGIGCRFPGASTPEAFWQLLRNGIDAVTVPSKNRVGIADESGSSKSETDNTPQGGFLDAIDQFDPRFFGISPEEAMVMDPQQRLLLEVTWQALEDAGQVPAHLAGSRTGVFVGIARSVYEQLVAAKSEDNNYYITGQNTSIAANRISFQFNFQGPSVAINTACSSSLVAVHQACQSLMLGESTLAVVGGVNLILSSHKTIKLSQAGLISTTGRCNSFDASADGYVRGEGVGVVILKPLAQAQADENHVYAVIRGSAVNHNGRGNGLTAPNPNAQKILLQDAYHRGGINLDQLQYVEAHGSGTVLGDALELKALGEFLAENRSKDALCAVGCVKTNLGNAEVASGIAGLIKVALALKHKQIPPTLHFQQPNPNVPFEKLPIEIQTNLTDWPLSNAPLIAGVSALGLGGTNAHVVIEGITVKSEPEPMLSCSDMPELFVLSAKSEKSLKTLAHNYQHLLTDQSELSITDICYTASTRRSHFSYRLAIVAHSLQDLQQQLQYLLSHEPSTFRHKTKRHRQSQTLPTLVYPSSSLSVSEREIVLNTLAHQWLKGIEIDWSQIYDSTSYQFISVPTYPFDRQSYWVMPLEIDRSSSRTLDDKLDRLALTTSENSSYTLDNAFVVPSTPTEKKLCHIWCAVLQLEQVGIHDNFFKLGGHSLLATQIISRIRETFAIELSILSLFESPTIRGLATEIDQKEFTTAQVTIPAIARDGYLPLSFAQQRLWFFEQLEGQSATYNIPQALQLSGPLNVSALEQALGEIVRRHESLRTTFQVIDDEPVQVIAPNSPISLPVIDLQSVPDSDRPVQVQQLANELASTPFDISQDLPIRTNLLKLAPESHMLVIVMHHIVSDGWSMGIFTQELSTLYRDFSHGHSSSLAELPIQYVDFARWQRQYLHDEVLDNQLTYWQHQLANAPTVLELPTDYPRPPVQTFQGSVVPFQLDAELSHKLQTLSQQSGTTLFVTLLSAFAVLLYRYSQTEDIVIGSPIANRNRREIEPLIGFFVNTLLLRTRLEGNPSFTELLDQVQQTALDAYAHQDLPFEKLVEVLNPDRNLSHHPLFQVLFVLQNAPTDVLELSDIQLSRVQLEQRIAKFDLTLSMRETATGLSGTFEYNCDLFKAETVQRLVGHFETLLQGIVEKPTTALSSLPILTRAEQQLLVEWNKTQTEYPQDKCIHQLFEGQVNCRPEAVAAMFGEQQITYQDLNQRANKLAHYLRSLGVGPDVLVGICVERSIEMIIGLLGILKAGGAYVPLDPTYPSERIAFMLKDAHVSVVLSQQSLSQSLCQYPAKIIELDGDCEQVENNSSANPESITTADNLAYVIYTSGSTGTPKGVTVPHRAVNRLVCNTNYITIQSSDRIAQASNASFDAATFEIWGALLHGAQLVGITKDVLLSPQQLEIQLSQQAITILFITTALFNQFASSSPQVFSSLRYLLFGGEAVDPKWVKVVLEHGKPENLLHVYGPTENTTFSSYYPVEAVSDDATTVPIGYPIANSQAYLLDKHLQLVPVGIPGELFLGGDGLAQGYLNRSELTSERFIPNPFSDDPEARLYKTGDLARYLPDGQIEFLGRIDYQVKIRGFRIELGEVEAALGKHPDVKDVLVVVCEKQPGDKRLIAYLTMHNSESSTSDLSSFMKEQLPDYMIPSAFVVLETFPLTPNGKVNRWSLPEPSWQPSNQNEEHIVVPRTVTEEMLAQIWSDILNLELLSSTRTQIDIHASFFEMGGHSLALARLVAQIQSIFQIELPLQALFQESSIAGLAKAIEAERRNQQSESSATTEKWSFLVPMQKSGDQPPMFLMAGSDGSDFQLATLAKLIYHLGVDRPVYGLRSQAFTGKHKPHSSLKAMAADYVKEICAVYPEGPYLLVGDCIGGILAFEVAQQLKSQGKEVARLVLLDAKPTMSRKTLKR
ncbi:MAG: amino acid adenylation domain-containing protein, partial [Cyanobacteria bacterium J06633_2]